MKKNKFGRVIDPLGSPDRISSIATSSTELFSKVELMSTRVESCSTKVELTNGQVKEVSEKVEQLQADNMQLREAIHLLTVSVGNLPTEMRDVVQNILRLSTSGDNNNTAPQLGVVAEEDPKLTPDELEEMAGISCNSFFTVR